MSGYRSIEEFVGWAYRRFEIEGASLDRVLADAERTYGPDGRFIREFVLEAWRFFAIEAMTGARPRVVPIPAMPQEDVSVAIEFAESDALERSRLSAARRARIVELVRGDDAPWARWMERHQESGAPVRLLNMTREQLLIAAATRDQESAEARRRAALCRSIADRLAPGQRARDVMTQEDIERMDADAQRGTPPIRVLA